MQHRMLPGGLLSSSWATLVFVDPCLKKNLNFFDMQSPGATLLVFSFGFLGVHSATAAKCLKFSNPKAQLFAKSSRATPRHGTPRHATLVEDALPHTMPRHATLRYVTLHYVTLSIVH